MKNKKAWRKPSKQLTKWIIKDICGNRSCAPPDEIGQHLVDNATSGTEKYPKNMVA
jgi:hypothetical protein